MELRYRRGPGNGSRNLSEERSGLNQPILRSLGQIFGWIWRTDESGGGEGRAVLVRVLIAIVWLPIQVTLSLLFATGGMFLLLILGIVLAPFIGGFFLIRHLVRSSSPDVEKPVGPADPSGRSES